MARQLESVDVGHVQIEDDDVVALSVVACETVSVYGGQGVVDVVGAHAPGGELFAQDQSVGGVVVDDQRPEGGEFGDGWAGAGRVLLGAEGDLEPEGAALGGAAGGSDRAVHELDQLVDDGES